MIHPRLIGKLSFPANPYALGCWVFGGKDWGSQREKDSIEAIHTALDMGVNHFDNAQLYGKGLAETILGRELKRVDRSKVFVATKLFLVNDKARMKFLVEESLRRLQMDYVDLFYIHWPSKKTDFRLGLEVLQTMKDSGKIKGIAVSNFNADQVSAATEITDIEANQIGYSLYWRWDEKKLFPFCREKGISLIAYNALAQGILTGKFPKDVTFPQGDNRPYTTFFRPDVWPKIHTSTETLKKILLPQAVSLPSIALRWVLLQKGVHSVLFGARNGEQVKENLKDLDKEVDPEVFSRITEFSDELHPSIPNTGNIFDFHP